MRGTRRRVNRQLHWQRFIPACAGNTWSGGCGADTPAVHPRVCGEHPFRPRNHHLQPGSSPRVRGTQQRHGDRHRNRRFIPACAGNTTTSAPAAPTSAVHPRVCGEHGVTEATGASPAGSSPRVRGTPGRHRAGERPHRFIPACAGNTSCWTTSGERWTVHPRVCGEHYSAGQAHALGRGSSPRVRGTPPRSASGRRRPRFIPACAGNTSGSCCGCRRGNGSSPRVRGTRLTFACRRRSTPVHPRVCGEHYSNARRVSWSFGSSPRVRGTRRRRAATPPPTPVHPRVCGEHPMTAWSTTSTSGSSPRVRGTPELVEVGLHAVRFIPACAGNTSEDVVVRVHPSGSSPRVRGTLKTRTFRRVVLTVHPRVCGEHIVPDAVIVLGAGSSPRVRGTLRHLETPSCQARFIPACAGNTFRLGAAFRGRSVHPRVCGEHKAALPLVPGHPRFIPACAGNTHGETRPSSAPPVHPRVCGEHEQQQPNAAPRNRFIPACAGNTSRNHQAALSRAVHPRVCGEHRPVQCAPGGQERFIPACAGNTPPSSRRSDCQPVHPRVCGEHVRVFDEITTADGSSPRVRGTPMMSRKGRHLGRFIPACAGNTATSGGKRTRASVHPRVCGEHVPRKAVRRPAHGSSPRVRGTLGTGGVVGVPVGSSPRVRGTQDRGVLCRRTLSVHPRVCGEHNSIGAVQTDNRGSSPRVRGTPIAAIVAVRGWRFIPACAGNTWSPVKAVSWGCGSSPRVRGTRTHSVFNSRRKPVHPRVCGEHAVRSFGTRQAIGSSPRVRGTREAGVSRVPCRRFIPACAGNTPQWGQGMCVSPVHPRVCGEHLVCDDARHYLHRFIPACAGNTSSPPRQRRCRSVHPRVCGEHASGGIRAWCPPRFIPACAGNTAPATGAASKTYGSSPRVRGTHVREGVRPGSMRFIPACAGNTATSRQRGGTSAVHPRVCGEHSFRRDDYVDDYGSSPRVRGTLRVKRRVEHRLRFIPACAGNTLRLALRFLRLPVHPRVCGEHLGGRTLDTWRTGSSPRVRGTPGAVK